MKKNRNFVTCKKHSAESSMTEKNIDRGKSRWLIRALALLIICRLSLLTALSAPADSSGFARAYTPEHPLVYEGVWDLWPYAYLNDNGEPEGYNVDLIRLMMERLGIPYVIRLKSSEEAFNDLKSGKSDLTLGLAVGYHDEYGLYGRNAVTLFTQSVATPKSKPVEIKTFRDLGKPGIKVYVNHTSMCYHLMKDYGWEENAIPEKDIREVIQHVSATEEGQIVWNTLTLKWLMRRYLIDNLQLTPVNMPHGEYKFMSHDQHLLDVLDEELTRLNATEALKPLQDKWFYPEHLHEGLPRWAVYAMVASGVLLLTMLVYLVSYRLQTLRLTRFNENRNSRLALILQTSGVRVWTYDIEANEFSWRNEKGQVAYTYSMEEFAQRYSEADFARLKEALGTMAASEPEGGQAEPTITLSLRARDTEEGQQELRDYVVVLSVLRRNRLGKATIIIGTKKDVTRERERERRDEERTLRYWSIFYTPVVGIMLFDKDGRLENINPRACEIFGCQEDEIIEEGVSVDDFFDLGGCSLEESDGYYASQYVDLNKIPAGKRRVKSVHRIGRFNNEVRLLAIHDEGELIGLFAILRPIDLLVDDYEHYDQARHRLSEEQRLLKTYDDHVDSVLRESDVRLAIYSPDTHTLTICRRVGDVQHTLTQTRCMTLVDDASKRQAMRVLNDMDMRTAREVSVSIGTTLRIRGGKMLKLLFCMRPVLGKDGRVTRYGGLLRDLSELSAIEAQLSIQEAKVQEVEATKNSFVKNMVQEIRKPMRTVVDYVERFDPQKPTDDEHELSKGILDNADDLLHLIDNILYLSRLQAHMVEFAPQPRNFAEVFEGQCQEGWMRYRNAYTRYIVESPYEQLVVDIDADNLGHAIRQIAANAAQHTATGAVRARYDYIGRRLIISIDDTGEGMPPEVLAEVNARDGYTSPTTKGLGLAITRELVSQMDGTVEISSEQGSGTTVYIMIPCHASVIRRKKLL